ncbi:thiol-disulfide oxidoreductase ResA [Alkalihalobacterium elongatum]|uniref:thiol-disulfide oxidoreductase ResA n=1 Tax=Alkalihalobacterium elongatum TaxID=2675466 RepID=UPI001C1FEB11|nr:thiol-disulfide oxidoreductase ResA [Alkalihalobacterium elongatum]
MKQRRLIIRSSILAIITIAIGYTFYINFFSDQSVVRAGDKAKNFVVADLAGEPIELRELEGKGIFLNFWGTFCPPCEKEMPIMEELYHEYKDQGIEIIALNVDESDLVVQTFVDRYQLSFPVAIDKGRKITEGYGIRPLPTTILIDEHGEVVRVHTGFMDESVIRRFMEEIKPQS